MGATMSDAATEELIQSLLASKQLGDETTEDLNDFLKDIENGELHKDDVAYVKALADRLGLAGGGKGKPKAARAKSSGSSKSDAIDWQERAVIAEAKIDDLQEEIDALNDDIQALKDDKAEAAPEPAVDIDELKDLINRLYDDENETLQDISNEDASAILKEMSQKLN
ncbi:MAG: hypothetical protein CMM48_01190 [Rhodospirillaceae bacterium]|nr:hypothetical protein [Rhodospirillaceae bacterium]|tara:strand:+ start:102 stop:605 length:504 start_codon:yes stop_codon:yes gene_type:complete